MPTPKSNFLEKQNFSASFSTQTFQQEKKPKKKIDEGIDRKNQPRFLLISKSVVVTSLNKVFGVADTSNNNNSINDFCN